MSKLKYRISQKAIDDLSDIWYYSYTNWSKEQADRYHKLVINEIEYMVQNYHLTRDVGYVRKGYRLALVKSHIIFFKRGMDDVVEVVRILHQQMDYTRILGT